jgi:hypothetical protein
MDDANALVSSGGLLRVKQRLAFPQAVFAMDPHGSNLGRNYLASVKSVFKKHSDAALIQLFHRFHEPRSTVTVVTDLVLALL